jgi:hypothetical protein
MKHMEDTTDDNEKTFRLFNIKTGELLRMEASMGDLNNIMSSLLLSRYTESVEQNNTQFINTCILSIFQLYDDV